MHLFCAALPNGGMGALFDPLSKTWDFFAVPKETSFVDSIAGRIDPAKITHITVINGPGPFLLLRSIAVTANTWKTFSKTPITLSTISTAVFLQKMFPTAKNVLMSAGKRNVLWGQNGQTKMEKKTLEEVFPLLPTVSWGGIFMNGVEDSFSPETFSQRVLPVSAERYWGECKKEAEHYHTDEIFPQYAKGDEWEKLF
ncbi:MAG: hypothetical protein WCJ84_01685 [Candidatus Peregrinibacteria bacterium]